MENRIEVFVAHSEAAAYVIKGMLESNNIASIILNQKDSAGLDSGQVRILVDPADETAAKSLIKSHQND